MHIEFKIPRLIDPDSKTGNNFKNRTVRLIVEQVNKWAAQYKTTAEFQEQTGLMLVKFKEDKYYTMFSLTWRPEPAYYCTAWHKIRIVHD